MNYVQYAVDFVSECVVTICRISMYLIALGVIGCVVLYFHVSVTCSINNSASSCFVAVGL